MKVLFVGNSYVYSHNVPRIVEEFCRARSIPLAHRELFCPGGTLRKQFDRYREEFSRAEDLRWDWVVLQEQSTLGHSTSGTEPVVQPPDAYYAGVLSFFDLFRSHSTCRFLIVQTWAREYAPEMQRTLDAAFTHISQIIESPVARVADAWRHAKSIDPSISLYDADGSHPTICGSYLESCCIFSSLTGQSSVDLPTIVRGNRFVEADCNTVQIAEAEEELVKIPTEKGLVLQRAADLVRFRQTQVR
jgi:hypothetical protein